MNKKYLKSTCYVIYSHMKAIGSGMVLSSFLVYTDNGDIVKAED